MDISAASLLVIVAFACLLLIVFRRPIRDYLGKEVANPFYDPAKSTQQYFMKSRQRIEATERLTERLALILNESKVNRRKVERIANDLRYLANEQAKEIAPNASVIEHRNNYWWLIDMQARKAEDIEATNGQNLDRLVLEEEEGAQGMIESIIETQEQTDQWLKEIGITPPRF